MATGAAKPSGPASKKVESNPYRPWAARFWHGMRLGTWMGVLARNRFRVHPLRWGLATTVTTASVTNSLAAPLQSAIYGRRIRETEIKDAPIFIIGHWRSGTTLLHELMVLDERFTYPTTLECFIPTDFMTISWMVRRMRFLLPAQRPMDNMITGWERPQEDEFALMNMGVLSPYLKMAFPNEPRDYLDHLDLNLPADELAKWKATLLWFLKTITFRTPKRIVLKSPPHTARVKTLLEMFPDARFVHIVRDPYVLFASNVKLWKTLYKFQGLQEPRYAGLEDYVFTCFEHMYRAFEAARDLVPADHMYEVRYEDLIRDKVGQMRSMYEHLQLGGFDALLPQLEEYLTSVKDYQTNRYDIDPVLREKIDRRWGPFMQRYGYCQPA